MEEVHLSLVNQVHLKVTADRSILMELADEFEWYAPNWRFHPKVKAGMWNGKISLVNRMTGQCYAGLAQRIKKFCDARDYKVSFSDEMYYDQISEEELLEFIAELNLPFEPYDYQIKGILKCLRSRRRTLLSPTSSGKSLMIYVITMWYLKNFDLKTLIIVPTTQLVDQMMSDFESYGYKGTYHKSTGGLSKSLNIPEDVVCSTWQAIDNGKSKRPDGWYDQFGVVVGDEAHGAAAKQLTTILGKLVDCKYRFGTTGTLHDDPLHVATIEGLFGPIYRTTYTSELIERGQSAKFKIKCVVLQYSDEIKKQMKGKTYHEEVEFLVNYGPRNNFIKKLALTLKKNKLIFFKLIDHGKILKDLISESTDKPVYLVDGGVDSKEREAIRKAMEEEEDAILLGSLGTTSTGVNLKRLHHMIAGAPSKSKIKVLQSIGRMLRKHAEKEVNGAILWDLIDDLSWKSHKNYTLRHFYERIKLYDAEAFSYELIYVKIG